MQRKQTHTQSFLIVSIMTDYLPFLHTHIHTHTHTHSNGEKGVKGGAKGFSWLDLEDGQESQQTITSYTPILINNSPGGYSPLLGGEVYSFEEVWG